MLKVGGFFAKKPNSPEKKPNSPSKKAKKKKESKRKFRDHIISIEIVTLIILIFLPVIFYITGHLTFNFTGP